MEQKLSFDQLPNAISLLGQKLEVIEKLLLQQNITNKDEPLDKLLTVQQAAEFLNLTVPTIYSKVSRNELPFMKQGKRLYFSQIELLEYLKAGRRKTNQEIALEAETYLNNKKVGGKNHG